MADKKISQLTTASLPLTGTEELAIVQSGSTVKATAQDIADLGGGVPYSIYLAKFQTNGTSDPTITVLENTMPVPITFTRGSAGSFSCTLVGSPFGSDNSKFFSRATINVGPSSTGLYINSNMQFIGFANLLSFSILDSSLAYVDNGGGTIEFRLYP